MTIGVLCGEVTFDDCPSLIGMLCQQTVRQNQMSVCPVVNANKPPKDIIQQEFARP